MNVFIVEDSISIQHYLAATINECNGKVCGIADAVDDAITGILQKKPDLVILDLWLKKGQSISVLKAVKESFPHIKIIIMTNRSIDIYMQPCLDLGADYFFQKNSRDYLILKNLLNGFSKRILSVS